MAARPELVVPSALRRIESYGKTASVPFTKGDFVTFVSGAMKRITSEAKVLGLFRDTEISSASTNYASTESISIEVDEMGIYEIDCSTTPVLATHFGNAYDLSDYKSVNFAASTNDTLICVGVTPDGRGLFKLNRYFGDGTA